MDALTPEEEARAMDDEKLVQTVQAGSAELDRRARVREAERTTDDMALAYLQAQGRENGAAWEAPLGFIGAYPRGWRVTHNGNAYEATAPGVTTTPPGDGWTETDRDAPVIPFWDPGAYNQNDLVRDTGQVWRALADGTDGPRPSEFPGGWALV